MVYNKNTALGEALACVRKYESIKVNNKSLDGTIYQQTPGVATHKRNVVIFCDTYARRDATDQASNTGALLTVEWQGVTYKGYIEKDVEWREWKDGHGVGAFVLLVKEVIE